MKARLKIILLGICATLVVGCGGPQPSKANDDVKLITDPINHLQYAELVTGTGEPCEWGDFIAVQCITRLRNGKVVTDTYEKGEPMKIKLGAGGVIRGYELGIPGMRVGGKRRLVIPSSLAYRDQERKGIPPNSELTSDIELLEILQKEIRPMERKESPSVEQKKK